MRLNLDPQNTLERGTPTTVLPHTKNFLDATQKDIKKWHHISHPSAEVTNTSNGGTTSLLVQAVHMAYDQHLPLALSPELIWHAVLHEIGTAVNENPDAHAHLFTKTPGEKKKVIVERDDFVYGAENNWAAMLDDFETTLRKDFVPPGMMGHCLPDLSTTISDQVSRVALIGAFMSAAQSFYDYICKTRCGIPEIRLDGTPADWRLICQKSATLGEVIQGLDGYFNELTPVLNKIALTAEGKEFDLEFWQSLYKKKGGSGGPFIGGWINALFAYTNTYKGPVKKNSNTLDWKNRLNSRFGGTTTDNFPPQLSSFPFIWDYYEKLIPMQIVSGPLSVAFDQEGFLQTKLGFAIAEREEKNG